MRLLVFIGLCLAFMTSGLSAAQPEKEALRLVKNLYVKNFTDEKMPMTQKLRSVYRRALANSKRHGEPVAGLDLIWTLNASDSDDDWYKSVRVAILKLEAEEALVQAKFRVFKGRKESEQHYRLVREGGRWRVDDIIYLDPANTTLSRLLETGAKE
jgi:hypothetical protein